MDRSAYDRVHIKSQIHVYTYMQSFSKLQVAFVFLKQVYIFFQFWSQIQYLRLNIFFTKKIIYVALKSALRVDKGDEKKEIIYYIYIYSGSYNSHATQQGFKRFIIAQKSLFWSNAHIYRVIVVRIGITHAACARSHSKWKIIRSAIKPDEE